MSFELSVFPDPEAMADAAFAKVLEQLGHLDRPIIGLATGSTPEPVYARIRDSHASGGFSLRYARAFALDEYLDLPSYHPESYRAVLQEELVGPKRAGLLDENLFTPVSTSSDPHGAADSYENAIADFGGVDLQIIGIGSNGHIGFNEPGSSLSSLTRVTYLTETTRRDNSRFFADNIDNVPTRCITQGLGTILTASSLLLVATGESKADAIARALEGPISPECPASVVQLHSDAVVLLDEAAASKLVDPPATVQGGPAKLGGGSAGSEARPSGSRGKPTSTGTVDERAAAGPDI